MHCGRRFYCLDVSVSPEDGQNGLKPVVINSVVVLTDSKYKSN
jgi:hypothetical protein